MSHSTFAADHFDHQCALLNIGQGLGGISITQFGTLYWAALSVQRGIPAFQAIIRDESLGIEIKGMSLMISSITTLLLMLMVIEP
ncbi:hypothetical protein DFH29DRAFT_797843 [Suillus ampliporus]|nr:hypothetical protein DFH29DRAFT_797843 [Suillus ampliporus]